MTPEAAGCFRPGAIPLPCPRGFPNSRVSHLLSLARGSRSSRGRAMGKRGSGCQEDRQDAAQGAHWPSLRLRICEMGSDNAASGDSPWQMGCCSVKSRPAHANLLQNASLGLQHAAEQSGEHPSTVMLSHGLRGALPVPPSPIALSSSQTKKPQAHKGAK